MALGHDKIMARLRYEEVGVDLSVYHGTFDATLAKGLGHLEGTSLPVGGVGTRSVITGHRGLATATMFTHLDKAKTGDVFSIETMGTTLAYRVTEIKVVAPEDTEELRTDPNRDLVTLITCTPLGINTHRILVTGERIFPTPKAQEEQAGQESKLPKTPWWAVIFGASVLGAGLYIRWAGYPAKPKKQRK